jgi:hypothetical protein
MADIFKNKDLIRNKISMEVVSLDNLDKKTFELVFSFFTLKELFKLMSLNKTIKESIETNNNLLGKACIDHYFSTKYQN